MTMLSEAKAVADAEAGTVLATVEIGAAPERVFEALVRSEDVLRWWGEPANKMSLWQADVRVGGKWRAEGKMKDGNPFVMEGEYTEVEAPHRLVLTWRSDWDAPHETRVTYMLEAIEGGTLLTLRHEGFAGRVAACRIHTSGWSRVLTWLEAGLRPIAAPRHYFLFRLLPPRPTFMQDITKEEFEVMQLHSVYWRGQLAAGKVVVFGPVADPAGGWGMGILNLEDPTEVDGLLANDPVSLSERGFRYEVLPMVRAVHA
jgi:uncharacterized protein YndB with AHSA1/START domain